MCTTPQGEVIGKRKKLWKMTLTQHLIGTAPMQPPLGIVFWARGKRPA
jgi:hypothetical protein